MNTITLTIPAELADDIKKQIEAFEAEQKPKPWPRDGCIYWFITANGQVIQSYWSGSIFDYDRLAYGNIYLTKEEAESVANRRKAQAKIDNYIREQGIKNGFTSGVPCYCPYFEHRASEVRIADWRTCEYPTVFSVCTREIAQQIIDAVGPETVEMAIRGRVGL